MIVRSLTVVAACFALAGCVSGGPSTEQPSSSVPTTSAAATPDLAQLRDELLAMKDADQAERTGQSTENGDVERAARLGEIIALIGWPGSDLVETDGASAAWLIAQHADFDVAFQQRALDLMRDAVARGVADPTELAFLDDRVAVNTGVPQTYGSQIRCVGGAPEPATPIVEPGTVDQRRADIGLEPLADYYAQLDCSQG